MQWSSEEHNALLQFLSNVTSSDPAVQAENISQLHRLQTWSAAPYAILDVLCHEHYPLSTRQAAVLILKQLLQLNPEFVHTLDVGAVESSLLGALADPIPAVRVGASLVVAAIVSEGGLLSKWPMLLNTLHQRSCNIVVQCQERKDTEGFSAIAMLLIGLSTCTRILCEECSTVLCELVSMNEETCSCLSELLGNLLHATSILLHETTSSIPAIESVIKAVTSCFTEDIFSLHESSNNDLDTSPEVGNETKHSPTHDILNYALSVHKASCLLIENLSNGMVSTGLVPVVLDYMNITLQWNSFGSSYTTRAVAAVLPQVFLCMMNTDEQTLVLCLDFINHLAQHEEGGRLVLSSLASEAATAIFRCSLLPPSMLLCSPSLEQTTHIPDDETTVRAFVQNQQATLAAIDEDDEYDYDYDGNDKSNNNNDNDNNDSDNEESVTSVRQALTELLDVMSCTCREDILAHLMPKLFSILTSESHGGDNESMQFIEYALFLFSELVEELFDDLDTVFVSGVVQNCWVTLATGSSSPYYIRYQAVRCVARVASGCAGSSQGFSTIKEVFSPSRAIQLLTDVIADDGNKQVQLEAIQSITTVILSSLEDCRRNNTSEGSECFSSVFQRLFSIFPHMQLGARTMMYRCISKIFPMALDIPSLIDETTVMHSITVLGTHGQQLASVFLPNTTQIASLSSAVELVSLLNTLVDVVFNAGRMVITQTLNPLVSFATMVLSCCHDESTSYTSSVSSSALSVYGSDLATLVFDMLDACCDAVLSDQELLSHSEAAMHGKRLLHEVILKYLEVNPQFHVVELCFQIMEHQPTEVELRRSCLAFLTSVGRFYDDFTIICRIYHICMNEVTRTPVAEKSISNAFLCLSQIFFRLILSNQEEKNYFLHNSVSEQELNTLVKILSHSLSSADVRKSTHMKTNAFSCALTLAVLHPNAFLHSEKIPSICRTLLENAALCLPHMENDVGDQFRVLTILPLLLSREEQQELLQFRQLPAMVKILNVVHKFTVKAPVELGNEVKKQWMPLMEL
ncbi:uncharacterized protein TM35_000261820 [Trypanosoma theileri]|uniref:Importin N-terminal domain-containing protein n=1 Tax=Trypanosoma theileri TaxID=67003 RepID=A0A1X0NRJ5_9TRYP|nr:uncharacterized protein TM35_000261820 [Trypanosoma theileri]ORC86730.1 hypothetical protein TM35_000261820 [Trypanosoma theileri]